MKFHPDDLLGGDFEFVRSAGPWLVRSTVKIVAYDPRRFGAQGGWRLVAPGYEAAWVADDLLIELFENEVLQ